MLDWPFGLIFGVLVLSLRPFDGLLPVARRDLYSMFLYVSPFLTLGICLPVTYLLLHPVCTRTKKLSSHHVGCAAEKLVTCTMRVGFAAFLCHLGAFLFETGTSPFWGALVITITNVLSWRFLRLWILFIFALRESSPRPCRLLPRLPLRTPSQCA